MKKQLSGILAMLMCLTCFSGCDVVNGAKDFVVGGYNKVEGWVGGLFGKEEEKVNEKLKSAAEFLKQSLLEDKNNVEARADYELERKSIGFNVTWTVNVTEGDPNGVVVLDYEDEPKVIIDVDEAAKEDILYTLTGTLKDAEGLTETVSVNRKVLKSGGVPKELTTAPEVGVAYKFFVYHEEFKQDYYFTGAMDGYYYGVTQASAEAADVYAEYVAGSTTEYYLYTKKDETSAKKYLTLKREPGNDGKDHNNLGLSEEEGSKFRFDDKLKTMVCDVTTDRTCYIGTFDKNDDIRASETKYASNETSYVGGLVTLIERETVSDADKAKFEAEALKIKTKFNGSADSFRLPVKGRRFPDVKISWKVEDNELVTLNARKDRLSVAAYTEKSSVKLTATLTIGAETKTVDVNLNLSLLYTTPEEIVNAAYNLGANESLDDPYTLTGVITEVKDAYSTEHKNITVIIQVGDMTDKLITCYRIKGDGADVIKVGDTITVTGIITNYSNSYGSTIEFVAGSTLDSYVEGEGGNQGGDEGDTLAQEEIVKAAYALEANQDLAGTQTLTGVITQVKDAYSSQFSNVSVVIQVGSLTDMPILCYRMKGTGADVIKVGDTITCTGTLTNYVGEAGYSTIEFKAGCTLDSYVEGEGGNEGEVTPPATEWTTVVPEAGKAYIFGMTQGNLENKVYYLAGGMQEYYMATTEDPSKAIETYIEATEGGYYFYTLNADGSKLYINMVVSADGEHVNGAYEATASTVYTIDETNKTLIAVVNEADYWFGTRNDKTYTTMGPCAVSYNGFNAQFYAEGAGNEGGTVTPPTTPDDGEGDDTTTTMTPEEIVKAAYALEKDTALEGTYTLTGVITRVETVYNSQFSNVSVLIQIGDLADMPILCYRMKGTGADVIQAGYTITCTGTLKNYNGTIEFDAGCTLDSYVYGEPPVVEGVTLSFADKANRTEYSTSKQVWQQNGITLTNNKGSSTSNVGDYAAPARFYKGSNVVIEGEKAISKIVFVAAGSSENKGYLLSALQAAGYTVTTAGDNYTIEFATPVETIEFTLSAGQARVAEIQVTFAA